MITNDNTNLVPKTTFNGRVLEFDFPGLEIGIAEYDEGPTGCTVFLFDNGGAMTAVDIRGGSVGTTGNHEWNDAICVAGGSLYGLEAASGVAAELFARANYSTNFEHIAAVSGAIIFDNLMDRQPIYPDNALGRAAAKAAQPGKFLLGQRGAGRSAGVGLGFGFIGKEPSGQGGAFGQVGPTRIAVFTVVNAIGAIVNREGDVVRGHFNQKKGRRQTALADLKDHLAEAGTAVSRPGNTTITVMVTNQKMSYGALTQVGRQVHSSMARAIHPFHTMFDGDVFYTVTTNEVENKSLNEIGLGVVASELAWDAVLSTVEVGDVAITK